MSDRIPLFEQLTASVGQPVALSAQELPELDSCQSADYMIQAGEVVQACSDGLVILASSATRCHRCAASGGCSMGIFARLGGRSAVRLSIPHPVRMPVGSWVWLGFAKKDFLRSVFILYFLPIVLGIVGALTGYVFLTDFFHPDFVSAVGLVLGLLLGLKIARSWALLSYAKVTVLWPE